jgi:hypothetical protein
MNNFPQRSDMQELNVLEIDEVAGGLLPEGSVGGNSNW